MNKEALSSNKYTSFTTSGSKYNRTIKIIWISTLSTIVFLFIIGSIWDLEIAKAFGDLNDNGFISGISLFWDRLSYTMTVPFIFAMAGIFLETANKKYGSKVSYLPKINIAIYIGFITVFAILFSFVTVDMANEDIGFGPGRNYWFGLDRIHIILVMSIQLSIEVFIMIGLAIYFRLGFSKRNDLLTRNYWIDGIKILVVFSVVGFLMDPSLKTFWGRPYYVHVEYQDVISKLPEGWNKETINQPNAEYLEWWQIQGFNPNYWKAFWSGDFGNTHWDDVAFPSGHMNSTSLLIYTTILLLLNGKRGDKLTWWKWTLLALAILDVVIMVIMQMVSRTHWLTDLMFTLAFLLLMFKPLNWLADHVVYFFLSLVWRKTSTAQSMMEVENKNKKIIYVKINDICWQVAKVKINKIETSKKYKRWHSDNFKY